MVKTKTTLKDILDSGTLSGKRLVKSSTDLKKLVKLLKENGYRIVLTQGVWDMVHDGHATYLEAAKKKGDILIVGVDSDSLTKARKGPNRPIVPQEERIRMISHLRHVDIITVRDLKHDIGMLIRLVEPDVLVVSKSTKDFTTKMKKEYGPHCGEIIDLQPQSTTTTTGRIRDLTIEGAEQLANEVNKLTADFVEKIRNGKS